MGRMDTSPGGSHQVLTVSQINRQVRTLLEDGFPSVWIEGEISNLARPPSGHVYFSLKDPSSQLRCAMFRQRSLRLPFRPQDGMAVVCRGRLSLYEARGEYQFIVETMEEAGEGRLQRAFEELKRRLAAEGLFDEAAKRPVPTLPRRIGIITSPTGAAVRDIVHILGRRFPAVPVRVYPVPVQGDGAAPAIAAALKLAGERRDCDVLIVARGGGSLEDLWAFNEEVVARAIRACPIPVISGVGHEIDFTIADFAADLRAPTPSGAAELAVPEQAVWLRTLSVHSERLRSLTVKHLAQQRKQVDWLSGRLALLHPGARLRQQSQRLDELLQRMTRACKGHQRHKRARLEQLATELRGRSPAALIARARQRNDAAVMRLRVAARRCLDANHQRLEVAARALQGISPTAVLERGYAIVSRANAQLVRDPAQVTAGDVLRVRVARGEFAAVVDEDDQI